MIRTMILVLYGVTLLFLALRSLRAQRLKERYALVLIFTGLPFLALAAWPNALSRLGAMMDMPYHTVMILLLTGFVLVELFELLSIISIQERRITTLAQNLSILMERDLPARQEPASVSGDRGPAASDG